MAAGRGYGIYPSQELSVVANSLRYRTLITCAASGPGVDLDCVLPKEYQIIHARNQNGLSYAVFWSDLVNLDKDATLVVNSSTGPFAHVNVPRDSIVLTPDNPLSAAPVSAPQDLIVVLNKLSVSKPL